MTVTVPVPITATAISDAMGIRPLNSPVRSAPRRSTAENQATNTTAVTATARYSKAASSVPVSGRSTGGPPATRTSIAAASSWAAASPHA
jgi:hypothetical protein